MDDYDDYVDSVLYSDQTADNYTPYGANGFGNLVYDVISILDGKDTYVYEGTDVGQAEREAINAYERSHRKAEVLVNRDGGSWKWVTSYPKQFAPGEKAIMTQAGFCLSSRCGQVNPLDCHCRYGMSPEEIKRWAAFD